MPFLLRQLLIITLFFFSGSVPAVAADAPLVSIDVQQAEISDVLTSLSNIAHINIIVDDSVTGKITLQLADVPFETALDLITRTKNLSYRNINGVTIVASAEKIAQRYGECQVFPLQFAKAEDLKKSMDGIIEDKYLKVDQSTNSLIFSGSRNDEEKLREAINKLDIPYKQITLEAQIISILQEDKKSLGANWEWDEIPAPETSSPSTESSTTKGGRIKFGPGYLFRYQATLNAMIANGRAKILATPHITATPGKEAIIFIGDHIPVVTEKISNSTTTQTTEYVDAGIKLIYTPQVNDEGDITSKVHVEVSTPTLIPELKNYRITTRSVDTYVRMKDGETLTIGGLINSEETETLTKIPFLSNLPILGNLFKNATKNKTKTEVMIFLKPKILYPKSPSKT